MINEFDNIFIGGFSGRRIRNDVDANFKGLGK